MKMNGAQIVVELLCAHGATTVFGYPGGSVLPIYDELYKNADRIHHVLTAHEQGAAHAADGYARTAGRPGVVIATSGPGATNLVTGIANAYLDSVPMVAITGNVAVPLLGRDSFQEVDIVGITQPIVKHSFEVREVEKLEDILNEAFHIADSGRRGPVLVDIPKSVQTDVCEYLGKPPLKKEKKRPRAFDLEHIAKIIAECKRPFIYAGGGVIAGGAEAELRSLSELLSAPVGLSMMGMTALPCDYGLNLGMCGMHGKYAATIAQSECDVMIALGVRFSDRATGNTDIFKQKKTIIHVDIDLAEIGKNVSTQIDVCGDVKEVLTELLKIIGPMRQEQWLARIEALKQVTISRDTGGQNNPQGIINAIGRHCDDDTVIVTDVGQHQIWVMQYCKFQKPRTLLTSGGLGAMGFGLGAAIGSCMANDKKRTVLFTGDGSFGMNLIELATAVSQKLPIVIIILNNNALGLPRQWQGMFHKGRYSQSTLDRKTDFASLAKAFGARGHSAATLFELEEIMAELPDGLPVVIDCKIDMDEKAFPMIPPGGSVKNMVREGGKYHGTIHS
ncbi:MAG: biosynthetic-type acetolactate synthase large subunit [Oscillospiraceae bacterium]|nr:biosynthetic-type acetolactate synthase large subunit [Oscillospiraceae bacterium]